ncbi:Late histone H1 [Orchesella cincta]|uniref:Late histone H1 n=1 Tax=Orchesella cincta TaxID=48709 RepID=A0A1D2M961_ORCCI|nr:Late histone H1 [Orchesella cincta]
MTGRGKGGKGLGKGVPSVTGKYSVITSKVSPSPPSVVSLVVVEDAVTYTEHARGRPSLPWTLSMLSSVKEELSTVLEVKQSIATSTLRIFECADNPKALLRATKSYKEQTLRITMKLKLIINKHVRTQLVVVYKATPAVSREYLFIEFYLQLTTSKPSFHVRNGRRSTPETTPAAASPKKGKAAAKPKVTKPKGEKKAAAHPSSNVMVVEAITKLNEKGGSSLQAIKKYIADVHKVDVEKQASFIRKALKKAVETGKLTQPKGKGASGSFKNQKPRNLKAAGSPAKKAAKKPAAKKAAAPKAAASPKAAKAPAKPKAAKSPKKAKAAPAAAKPAPAAKPKAAPKAKPAAEKKVAKKAPVKATAPKVKLPKTLKAKSPAKPKTASPKKAASKAKK